MTKRRTTILLTIVLLAGAAVLVLWLARKPIASGYIDRSLAARGVTARYRIADLGLGRQRLTNIVIGDPAHPDLVADWIEVQTGIGFSGVRVAAIRAGQVRMNARLVDGRLRLGAIDKLLPTASGKPVALPAIHADIADLRMRLETPWGVAGLKLAGRGRLDNGFAGQLAAVTGPVVIGGCATDRATAYLALRTRTAGPRISGPVRIARGRCGTALLQDGAVNVVVTLGARFDAWRGAAALVARAVGMPGTRGSALTGKMTFAGTRAATSGDVQLSSGQFASGDVAGNRATVTGAYRVAAGGATISGTAGAQGVSLGRAMLAAVSHTGSSADATPLGPVLRNASDAAARAGRAFDLTGDFTATTTGSGGKLHLAVLHGNSASGAIVEARGGTGIDYAWPGDGVRFDTVITSRGGGLPQLRVAVARADATGPIAGTAFVAPYAAGGSRLTLAPVRFSATPGGATRVTTQATISGPFPGGMVDRVWMPVVAFWNGRNRFFLNPDCAPVAVTRLAISGLVLRPARLSICPVDGAWVKSDRGRLGGGVVVAAPALSGMLGATPVSIAAGSATAFVADPHFTVADLRLAFGSTDRRSSLSFATLDGRIAGSRISGVFGDGGGQIAHVPLILSATAGTWRLDGGRLDADGALTVSDDAPDPRFKPIAAQGVNLSLAASRIAVTGALVQPILNVPVATVRIAHDLSGGTGQADIAVPGISFGDTIQPDDLTRLTYGVIADVKGVVSGEGHIRWNPAGVTSDGVFRTANTDLAAALGPVTGIASEIRFTDLLALESAPGQRATVKSINPGIAVDDGEIFYQTLSGARVRVERGCWPFAGGALTLEPTLLDFGQATERRMTFLVSGMEAGKFLQQFNFTNLNATGMFDGRLPMVFDTTGGRIEQGLLKVRPGGGTLSYVGELSQKDVGFWPNLAFQALKSLRYRDLSIVMNGPLAGEMVTDVRFAGVGQGQGAKRNFILDRLQKLPFIFNIRIKAPFRQLIDSAQSFYDPRRLIERNLPALLEEQNKRAAPPATPTPSIQSAPVQPNDSRNVP